MAAEGRGAIRLDFEARGISQLKSEVGGLESTLARFTTGAGLAGLGLGALATAANAVTTAISNTFKEAKQFQFLTTQFKGDVDAAEEAVRFLVDDIDLMQAQLKMSNAGLSVTGQQFTDLAEVSDRLARVVGVDTKTAFDDITNALTTGNPKALRRYGVIVDSEQAEIKYAAALFKSRKELTDVEKVHARQEEMLRRTIEKRGQLTAAANSVGTAWRRAWDGISDATRDAVIQAQKWADIMTNPRVVAEGIRLFTGASKEQAAAVEKAAAAVKLLQERVDQAKAKQAKKAAIDASPGIFDFGAQGIVSTMGGGRRGGGRRGRAGGGGGPQYFDFFNAEMGLENENEFNRLMEETQNRRQKALLKNELDAETARQKFGEQLQRGKQADAKKRAEESKQLFASVDALVADPQITKIRTFQAEMEKLGATSAAAGDGIAYFKQRSWEAFGTGIMELGIQAVQSFGMSFHAAMVQSIDQGKTFAQALGESLKILCYQLSGTLFAKGIAATIEAAALAAAIVTAPLAPGYLAQAGIYFAGATAMLGAGAALSSALRGGQAPAVGGSRGSVAPRPATVKQTTVQAGPTYVSVYLGSPGDPAAANIMRKQATAQAA